MMMMDEEGNTLPHMLFFHLSLIFTPELLDAATIQQPHHGSQMLYFIVWFLV